MPADADRGAIALAERIFALLDDAQFGSTYKYALLLALIDACVERTNEYGEPPDSLVPGDLAAKVMELYWRQTALYTPPRGRRAFLLRQARDATGRIVDVIVNLREKAGDAATSLSRVRETERDAYKEALHEVEITLTKESLPRLQRSSATGNEEFLYRIAWEGHIERRDIRRHQLGGGPGRDYDNRVHFQPGVAAQLVELNGLLRPFIRREWTALVERMNRLDESQLEDFLFGTERADNEVVRRPLVELQAGRCFYCGESLPDGGARAEVDHFIPWSRQPLDLIENLVAAHGQCNQKKRHFLAAPPHVERWRRRLDEPSQRRGLSAIAEAHTRESDPARALGVARGVYLRLPPSTRLWQRGDEFTPFAPEPLVAALGAGGG